MMRTFLCIPVDRARRERLADLSDEARRLIQARASWVRRENFHVTLRFLGEIDPMLTVDLERVCGEVTANTFPFKLTIDRVGAFPDAKRPRVLWAGGEATPPFRMLATEIDRKLVSLDFPRGRAESVAHITLARFKGRPDSGIAQTIAGLSVITNWNLLADRIVLMESRLTSRGAVYAPLFTLPFGGGNTDGPG